MTTAIDRYATPVRPLDRPLVGRQRETMAILAGLNRPEMSNLLLLGPAGCGKTTIIQHVAGADTARDYYELALSRLPGDHPGQALTALFDELASLARPAVLFVDEFHQVMRMDPSVAESLKPLLANSAKRGIRLICATTLEEYNETIAANQALAERLTRVNIEEPDDQTTLAILESVARAAGAGSVEPGLLQRIVQATAQHLPAQSQPRKSILVLDAMIGWQRTTGQALDQRLLAHVMETGYGIRIAMHVDGASIRERLDRAVIAQPYATSAIESRLQVCVAGLNDPERPMASFLFTGSTGVGKTAMARQLAMLLFDSPRSLLRFDMTEYSRPDSVERFRNALAERVWEHPYSVILLDEVEKACGDATRLLLQVIDDGRLTNRYGREVSFTNSYLVMTTNAGSEIYANIARYDRSDDPAAFVRKYDALIRRSLTETTGGNRMPPELLGRIDMVVPFHPLSRDTLRRIVLNRLQELKRRLDEEHGIQLAVHERVLTYLVDELADTDSDAGGARQAIHLIDTELMALVGRAINTGRHVTRLSVTVDGTMRVDDKHLLEGDARLRVDAA